MISYAAPLSPWGINAHFNRSNEFAFRTDEQFRLLQEAGVRSLRFDMGFRSVCRVKGEYHFEDFDQVLAKAEAYGMTVLPILQGYYWEVERVRKDAIPMHEHPEEWRLYVRATAEHFKGRIRLWSYWNEPQGGFWRPNPNAQQYVSLLKITCEELKKVDPENRILLGGINPDFLKDVYAYGGGNCFDVVSTHPYGWGPDRSQAVPLLLDKFKKVLSENGHAEKQIYYTECGCNTAQHQFATAQPMAIRQALDLAAARIGRKFGEGPLKIAVPNMASLKHPDTLTKRVPWLPGAVFVPVETTQIDSLSIDDYPVILADQTVYEDSVTPLLNYGKKGGIVLACGDIPLYYFYYRNDAGNMAQKGGATTLHPLFHTNWFAWWNRKNTPQSTSKVIPAQGMEHYGFKVSAGYATRYMAPPENCPDDTYIPLLKGVQQDFEGDVLSIYLRKDWKGAIVASTLTRYLPIYTEQEQADMIQTVMLDALTRGIPQVYFYEFRNSGNHGNEREHNFGFVRRDDLRPKPVYHAYKAMTKALGAYPEFMRELPCEIGFKMLLFKRAEDGKQVLAFWSIHPGTDYKLSFSDEIYRDGAAHFLISDDFTPIPSLQKLEKQSIGK